MKTPMQMLIDDLKEMSSAAHITHRAGLDYAIEIANNLLEEEKRQIMEAWINGGSMMGAKNAEQYYNQTYNNENKQDTIQ